MTTLLTKLSKYLSIVDVKNKRKNSLQQMPPIYRVPSSVVQCANICLECYYFYYFSFFYHLLTQLIATTYYKFI